MAITKYHYSQSSVDSQPRMTTEETLQLQQINTPCSDTAQHRVLMAETRIHFSFSVDTVLNILGAAMILISLVVASVLGKTGLTFEVHCQ